MTETQPPDLVRARSAGNTHAVPAWERAWGTPLARLLDSAPFASGSSGRYARIPLESFSPHPPHRSSRSQRHSLCDPVGSARRPARHSPPMACWTFEAPPAVGTSRGRCERETSLREQNTKTRQTRKKSEKPAPGWEAVAFIPGIAGQFPGLRRHAQGAVLPTARAHSSVGRAVDF